MALRLLTSFTSPFGRRARAAVIELDLKDRVEVVATDPWATPAPAELLALNPLCKVPALLTDSGDALVDSSLILEYLATQGTGLLAAPTEPEYWQRRRQEQIALGVIEAAVAWVLEGRRAEGLVDPSRRERQMAAITRSLDVLEKDNVHRMSGAVIGTMEITLACALEYVDFRMGHVDWRASHPELAKWLAEMRERPSLAQTRPPR